MMTPCNWNFLTSQYDLLYVTTATIISKQNVSKTCLENKTKHVSPTGGPREGRAGHLGRGGPSVGGQDVLQLPGDHHHYEDVVVIVVVGGGGDGGDLDVVVVVVQHLDHQ